MSLFLGGCGRDAPRRETRPPAEEASSRPLRTTSSRIALGNLDGQIRTHTKLVERRPGDVGLAASLARFLMTRGEVLGRLEDYDAADALAEDAVAERPEDAQAYLLRASVRALFHRFDGALADVGEAERRGGPAPEIEARRAAILGAIGRTGEAVAIQRRIAETRPTLTSLGALAGLLADQGDLPGAERQFAEARRVHRDPSPFPVAWLEFQQALSYERARRPARARELYEAAHDRLPGYAQVSSHLAAFLDRDGDHRGAIALLEPIVAQSDDPEYSGQLSALYRVIGRTAEADRLREEARARYESLTARHPEAFADHAARFWLNVAGDPGKALVLAERNLSVRRTDEAYQLVIGAALAASAAPRACEVADLARDRPHPLTDLLLALRSAYAACHRAGDVARVDGRLGAGAH